MGEKQRRRTRPGDFAPGRAILEATGLSRKEWFEILNEAGAKTWDEAKIARWLGGKHDIDSRWCQLVTNDYLVQRGPREGVKTGKILVTKTLRIPAPELWPYLADEDMRREWLDLELGLKAAGAASLRFDGGGNSRVTMAVSEMDDTRSGEPRCRMTLRHYRIAEESEKETKAFWSSALARLDEHISQG